MVLLCAFCGSKQGTESRTHHKFLLKDKKVLELWLQHMSLGSNFVPKKYSVSCSDHFEVKCFQESTNKKCLRFGSFPTLFGEYKSICVYCHAVKGQDKKRSFHKFPLDNPKLLEKWVVAMELVDFKPNEKSLLCSYHFDKKCFRSSGRGLVLKTNAVPALFISPNSGGTSTKIQENISNLSNKTHDNGNQLITWQQNIKRISPELFTSSSKIQRSDRPFTFTYT